MRRRVNTVSVAGGNKTFPGRMETLRGFELLPPRVSFGVLKEGCTYIHSVLIKNVGIDSCRFKVKQPPLSTGMARAVPSWTGECWPVAPYLVNGQEICERLKRSLPLLVNYIRHS